MLDPDGSGWLFNSLACSTNGFFLVAGAGGNLSGAPICISKDGGYTWSATTAPLLYWLAVASSASGAQLAASGEGSTTAPDGAGVYVSADAGVTWNRSATFIGAIACSADGKHLVVVKSPEYQGSPNPSSIYISSDAGASWSAASEPASTNRWTAVACSADGMGLVAIGSTYDQRMTDLFLSSDGGFSWLPVGLPKASWQRVASSADGKRLVAASAFPSSLYTSSDSGASWTPQPGAPLEDWTALASSASGSNLVAGGWVDQGQIYTSPDAGVHWYSTNNPPSLHNGKPLGWLAVVSSADGNRLLAAPSSITGLYSLHRPVVELAALEVTQVIQDWSNSIPLIADKETYLRAHLQLPLTNSGPVQVGDARLYGAGPSGPLPGSPLTPINPGGALAVVNITNAASPTIRSRFARSLNFRLPPAWIVPGTLRLQLTWTNSGGLMIPVNVVSTDAVVSVAFTAEETPLLTFFAFHWADNLVDRVTPTATLEDMRKRILATYPVSRVDAGPVRPYNWQEYGLPDLEVVLPRLRCQQLLDSHSYANVTNRIYYGGILALPADNLPYFGLGQLPGTCAAGFTLGTYGDARLTPPHEVAHNLGRPHDVDEALFSTGTDLAGNLYVKGPCGEGADPGYTYPLFQPVGGVLRPTLGPMTNGVNSLVYGLDTLTLKQNPALEPVLDPGQYFDLMGYCRGGPANGPTLPLERWPSTFTYQELLSSINTTFGSQATPLVGGGAFVLVRGQVDLVAGTASFLPFVTVDLAANPPAPAPGTNLVLEVLDGGGAVLQQVSFDPDRFQTEENDSTVRGDFMVPLATDPSLRGVRLLYRGKLVASVTAPAAPPAFSVVSPAGGQSFSSGPVTIDWQPAAGAKSYVVQYSPDNGQSWQTLAVDWSGPPYVVDSAVLSASSQAKVRVFANDGFNSTVAQSPAAFTIQPHPPRLSLNSPLEGSSFSVNQQLFLDLEAIDERDGPLDGASVRWVSDLDGPLGQGAVLNFPASRLRQGHHTMTATATDSQGLTNAVVVHLFALVQPPPQLSLLVSGSQGYVVWPSSYTNDYALQASAVSTSGWATLTNVPQVLDKLQGVPVDTSASGMRFFRLLFKQ